MRKTIIAALLLTPLAAMPAHADDRILTIFGSDKCPADTICVRAPEGERYRIPKNLREAPSIAPQNQAWAQRARSIDALGRTGVGSCSASGPGGWTGCYAQQMRQARAEEQEAAAQNAPGVDSGN